MLLLKVQKLNYKYRDLTQTRVIWEKKRVRERTEKAVALVQNTGKIKILKTRER